MIAFIEKPKIWFYLEPDGERHRMMYENLCNAAKQLALEIREEDTYMYLDFKKRQSPEDGFRISYHSVGSEPYVWRMKETSIPYFYSIDKFGYSGWSELSTHTNTHAEKISSCNSLQSASYCRQIANWLIENNLSKYNQSSIDFNFPHPYILYPLQILKDQVAVHHKHHPLKILFKAAKAASKTKHYLIVKRHPYCKSYLVKMALKWLEVTNKYFILSNASITKLLFGCKSVIVGNSGTGLEALIYGKKVYSFSKSEYQMATININSEHDIESVFTSKIDEDHTIETGYKFVNYYLKEMCFDCRDIEDIKKSLKKIIKITENRQWHTNDQLHNFI